MLAEILDIPPKKACNALCNNNGRRGRASREDRRQRLL